MNLLSAIGNIGKDAETRHTAKGDSITSFSFALTSGYGDKSETTWINCNYWGKRGESVAQYLLKGTKVGINGELTNRKYINKDGVEKYSLEVNISSLTLLGSESDSSMSLEEKQRSKVDTSMPMDEIESDLPF